MTVRVRIAPSPTGDPHVGTAYVALFNLAFARRHGGQFLLRIEDTDRVRFDPNSERMIFESLRWLGLNWDEGPDVGGPFGPYRQSERFEIYKKYADELIARGGAYWCFCSSERLESVRAAQTAAKRQPKYDGHCRFLPEREVRERIERNEPRVVRMRIPEPGECRFTDLVRGEVVYAHDVLDDQVLLKTDGFPTYHLANVVDDHLMEITHVMRAEEWIPSTPKHVLLYQAFGWEPPKFAHLSLLRNADRSKISKRKNPTSLIWYRDQGYLPEALVNFLGLMGYSMPDGREIFRFDDMRDSFDIARIPTTAPVFDLKKLDWLNGEYIRALPVEDLARRLEAFGAKAPDAATLRTIVPLVRERMKRLSEWNEATDFFFAEALIYDAATLVPKKRTPAEAKQALEAALAVIETAPAWEAKSLEEGLRAHAESMGWKVGDLFMPIRVAVTGKTATPPLLESMVVVGKDRVVARLRAAIGKLG